MGDFALQGLFLSAVVLNFMLCLRKYRVWITGAALAMVLPLSIWLSHALLEERMGLDSWNDALAWSAAVFFPLAFITAWRRGQAVFRVAAPLLTILSLGISWAMRLSQGESGNVLFTLFAMVIILTCLIVPGLPRGLISLAKGVIVGGNRATNVVGGLGVLLCALPLLLLSHKNGAFIQITLPFVGSVQPVELGRVIIVLLLAVLVARWRPQLGTFVPIGGRAVWLYAKVLGFAVLALLVGVLSNDYGPVLVLGSASAAILLVSGLPKRVSVTAGLMTFGSAVLLAVFDEKVTNRLASMGDPCGVDQVKRGVLALSHGPVGLGWGNLRAIPEHGRDMLLSSIAFELGVIPLFLVIACVGLATWASIEACRSAGTEAHYLAALGLMTMWAGQTLLLVAGNLALLPLVGMPVPFASTNGSSLIASALMFGFITSSFVRADKAGAAVSSKMAGRSRTWSVGVAALCLALAASLMYRAVTAGSFVEWVGQGKSCGEKGDLIATLFMAPARTGKLLTADGEIIAETVAKDGKKLRSANAKRAARHDSYKSLVGFSEYPGLDALIRDESCLLTDCPVVRTTINSKVQAAAWQGLQTHTGAVVAVDLNSGGILAYTSAEDGQPVSSADPVRLKAVTPGSVMNTLTGAAGIEKGLSLERSVRSEYKNVRALERACGGSLGKAMAVSCNPYFAEMGDELGLEGVREITDRWLNQQPTISGLRIQPSKLLDSSEDASAVPRAAIGLGSSRVTPLALLGGVSLIARGGQGLCMKLLPDDEAGCSDATMDPAAAQVISDAMRQVVVKGSVRQVEKLQLVEAAGKTGTAGVGGGSANATFVAFAPASQPRVAVAVVLEPSSQHPTGLVGGEDAAPIAAEVLEVALKEVG